MADDEADVSRTCSVCSLSFDDLKSIIQCTKCLSYFHGKCESVDLRGFHMKKSWRCKKCVACYGECERDRKRSRSDNGDVWVVDSNILENLMDMVKKLTIDNEEFRNKLDTVIEENKLIREELSILRSEKVHADKQRTTTYASAVTNNNNNTIDRTQRVKMPVPQRIVPAQGDSTATSHPRPEASSEVSNAVKDGFQAAKSRRRRISKPIILGTDTSVDASGSGNALEGVERRHWLYVGRVKSGTTAEMVIEFLKSSRNINDVRCVPLANNDDICSFKVGVRESLISDLLDPKIWPKGVAVREFINFPRNGIRGGNFRSQGQSETTSQVQPSGSPSSNKVMDFQEVNQQDDQT